MKISNIQHRDLRFYNNIFAGKNGLFALAKNAENLQSSGNVYLAGAKPGTQNKNELVAADFKPNLKLQEKSDGWWLEMTVDDNWTATQKRDIITTGLLGKAKIPNAPFEQRDGIPYRLDTDYFGKKINNNPTPGPFKLTGQKRISLKVWPKKQHKQ